MRLDQEHIDALAAKFVLQPQRFDVVVGSNLFGDILSDLAAAVAGSIGIAPSANLDPTKEYPSMFEPETRTGDLGGSASTVEVTEALVAQLG